MPRKTNIAIWATILLGLIITLLGCSDDWHGASENSSLTQMYILPNTQKGIVTWLEPVTDEQYKSTNN